MSETIPVRTQILVIGGGPAGSYAAAALAREGFQVVLLEATTFPRYHIGETLLASVRPFLKFIDADDTVRSYGFTVKPGAAFKLNRYKREGYIDFITSLGPNNGSWNVIRAEFDDLLLKHAAKCGTTVVEETKVTELQFEGERPVSATWVSHGGTEGQIAFDYLVDASGRNGIMSTKYLRNRHFNKSLKNIAYWGYWEGAGCYKPGSARGNAVWLEALPDESGWAWFIPLHDGSTSVVIVMDQDTNNRKKREVQNTSGVTSLVHYLREVQKVPELMKLLEEATLRHPGQPDAIKSASDFSYSAATYAGDHYRIAGDAGGESWAWFLLIVLGVYKQIRNQSVPVMSDVDEGNFDRAFDLLRPVIQGTVDIGKTLTEDEPEKTIDFCGHLLSPTDLEMYKAVSERVSPELLDLAAPIMTKPELDTLLDAADEEARHVVCEINALKQVHKMYHPVENFTTESHLGFKAVMQHGRLGLAAAA